MKKNNSKLNIIYHLIKIPIILFIIFLSYNLLNNGKEVQKINTYNASQNDASNGIFNVTEWKCKLVEIVEKKIKNTKFEKLSELIIDEIVKYYHENTNDIRKQEVLTYNNKKSFLKNIGNVAKKSYKKVKTKGLDLIIKKSAKFVNEKIAQNKDKIQELVSRKTKELINDSLKGELDSKSFSKECEPKKIILKSTAEIDKKQNKLFLKWWLVFLVIMLIISWLYYKKVTPQSSNKEMNSLRKWLLIDASLLAIILLFLGVMLPMMEINATLINLKFTLLGEEVLFSNQSLYFRSKSIYDIVTILLPVNPMIGIAVMVFSVVLPAIKLIITFILIFSKTPSKKLQWIISNLGKWSMADVFLIAVFLANLSFQNILSDQMKSLSQNKSAQMAVNTSHSSIQIGFYFFFGYVILSMIISKLTVQYLKERDEN